MSDTPTSPLYKQLEVLAIELADKAYSEGRGELQSLASTLMRFSHRAQREVLMDQKITAAQQRKLGLQFAQANVQQVRIVSYKPFDLPDGWIAVEIMYTSDGHTIYGGIAPEGDMHT